VGGRGYQYEINGFKFDGGPTVMTAPYMFDELFALAGKKREDYFDLIALDPFYRIFNEKGEPYNYYRDLEMAKKIAPLDKEIDRYYRQIELDCATLMTLQAPVAQDLRLLSAFMQLVRDLERIGDYAKDLAEIALKLFAYTPHDCMSEIEAMSHHAQYMLATSLVALADLDQEAGPKVKELDNTVDRAYEHLYHTLAHQSPRQE
jgi:phytoene dehydrogenase-like protein